ncbi:MAG: cupin domain-containing protein [Cyanobacteria bacterium P01_E01_bin.6]
MIVNPSDVPDRVGTGYPEPFRAVVAGRIRKKLGDAVGLNNFGVNLTTLEPGSASAMRHWHEKQDEFVYMVEGELTLVTDAGETLLTTGMCAGFPAGNGDGHHLVNRTNQPAVYLEIGDRTPNDKVVYPDIDLRAHGTSEGWQFTHADGSPYD